MNENEKMMMVAIARREGRDEVRRVLTGLALLALAAGIARAALRSFDDPPVEAIALPPVREAT